MTQKDRGPQSYIRCDEALSASNISHARCESKTEVMRLTKMGSATVARRNTGLVDQEWKTALNAATANHARHRQLLWDLDWPRSLFEAATARRATRKKLAVVRAAKIVPRRKYTIWKLIKSAPEANFPSLTGFAELHRLPLHECRDDACLWKCISELASLENLN
ncbi:hypothetical protein CALCODRAFT_19430 [Calocera cornea HHB12733]|uniref:Uncharacterized protein n=1 Tax=Calocera cornea HHB12733 TaxID=1353952 RepID=A0A165E7M3_9BASI|nr:hypothetical protein CALCODRAFT_19430 [Calocera cornea HHB12733]